MLGYAFGVCCSVSLHRLYDRALYLFVCSDGLPRHAVLLKNFLDTFCIASLVQRATCAGYIDVKFSKCIGNDCSTRLPFIDLDAKCKIAKVYLQPSIHNLPYMPPYTPRTVPKKK